MFTRVVEVTAKPGKARELSRTIGDKILSILQNQSGFVDELVLISEESPDEILALSFWKTRENADNYNRNHFSEVTKLIQPFSEGPPRVRAFNVEQSISHKIASGKAA